MAGGKTGVDEELKQLKVIQDELRELEAARQKFFQQANENGMVKQELDLLDDSTPVYKLIGPVLMNQDLDEAKQNVEKRLEFIQREMEKLQKQIDDKREEEGKLGDKIAEAQQSMRQRAAEEAHKAAAEAK